MNFKICSCQKDKFALWKSFLENLKVLLKREVRFDFIKKFPDDLEENIDLFYASFSSSLYLIGKNYYPLAKFKNQDEFYLALSFHSLENLKTKERIKIIILNRSIFFYLVFYILVSKLYIDFSKVQIISKDSYEEIIDEIFNNSADLYILPEKRAKPFSNKFLFIERFPFKVSHYFMASINNPLFSEIKKALFLINKEIIKSLGFEDIEEINLWEEEFIKNSYWLSIVFPQLIEKCSILDIFLNAPFFGICVYHETIIYVNNYLCQLLKYTPEEFKNLSPLAVLYYKEDKERVKEIIKRRLKGEIFFSSYEPVAFKTKYGEKIETLAFAGTIFYQNKYCGFAIIVDVTKFKKLERFNQLLSTVNQILIYCNYKEEIYEKILPVIYEILELKGIWISDQKGEITLSYPKEFKPPKDLVFSAAQKSIYKLDIPPYSILSIPLIKNGKIVNILNLFTDDPNLFNEEYIELLKQLQEDLNFALNKVELIKKDLILRKFVEKTDNLLIITDENGKIEYINLYGEKLFGIKKEDLYKENCFKLLHIPIEIIKSKIDTTRFTIYYKPDKEKVLLELKISFIEIPYETKVVIIGKDLTKELEYEKEIEQLQNQDPLTGCLNKRGFQKKVSSLLSVLNRPSALVMIDFYNFSYISHFYGFEVGDFCLKEITRRFQNMLEDKGILGRTGGDEFSLFIIDIEDGLIEWIKKIISLLSEPVVYKDMKISLNWNIGIAIYPQDGENLDILWGKADLVLFEAKKKASNTVEIYNTQIEEEVKKTFQIEMLIKKAVEKNLFVFFYQPWFKTETLKIAGVEALCRIKEKDQLILPNEFISFLEKSSYLSDFDFLCFKENIEKIKKWGIPVSLNVSSQSLKTLNFVNLFNHFKDTLSKYPYFLILEITEHTLVENIEKVKNILENIKFFKIKISLDDFGVGYSSLKLLKDFPIDIIKIDLSFIREMVRDIKTYHIVENIINLAHLLDMKVIAEGVETKEQLELLKKLKCDYVQGFLLSYPLSEKEITNLIKQSKSK